MPSSSPTRRQVVLAAGGMGLVPWATAMTPQASPAQAQPVNEADSTATALGYVADARRVDRKRFPQHRDEQRCRACALYQASGPTCDTFAGRLITPDGWCSAWKRKAK